jgi:hypothetical protein
MTMTTGEYRAADVDDLRALARELDDAADEVARSSRAVRQAAASVCRDLGSVPGSLAETVFELRERAHDLRVRAARLVCAPEPERPGSVTFTIPPPEPEDDGGGGWGHLALDALGFVPVVGAVPDGINALWYAAEGDATNAALSGAALVPLVGDAAGAGKFVGKSADEVGALLRSPSGNERVFEVADLVANEGLKASEDTVTHVIRDHVGQRVDDMARRAVAEGHDVSTFHDLQRAADAIDAAMRANPDLVTEVLSGAAKQRRLVTRVGDLGDLGVVVSPDGTVAPATEIRVILRSTDDGAVVVTAMLEAL